MAEDNYPRRRAEQLLETRNIYWSHGKVTGAQRSLRNGHAGCVVWLTGLSASGKSTIATDLERELFQPGPRHAYILDGDNVRPASQARTLGFSPRPQKHSSGGRGHDFADAGIGHITAFISPDRSDRELGRQLMPAGTFIEVYVNAPLEVCRRATTTKRTLPSGSGAPIEKSEFTGISAPYEAPGHPEIELRTDQLTAAESVTRLIEYLDVRDSDSEIADSTLNHGLCVSRLQRARAYRNSGSMPPAPRRTRRDRPKSKPFPRHRNILGNKPWSIS